MRQSTRSLIIAFGTAAVVAVAPFALDRGQTAEDRSAVSSSATTVAALPVAPVEDGTAGGPAAAEGVPPTTPDPSPSPTADSAARGSGMGGDLPPEALPSPPYPQCPITEAGPWWTDPGDPYTCIPPGSIPFHEPTPPGIPPELLEPIFETPGAEPGAGDDCRTTGALQCSVTIMGEVYIVTFYEGKPVGVAEAR